MNRFAVASPILRLGPPVPKSAQRRLTLFALGLSKNLAAIGG